MPDISNIDYLDGGSGFQVGPSTLQRQLTNIDVLDYVIFIEPPPEAVMPFPTTPRYFLNFRNSDIGLTPTFVSFKRTDTLTVMTPPPGGIVELGNGRYYFDYTWNTPTDPSIVFVVDGGASIPTEEVRFIQGGISPRDVFVDEPTSQVVDDVWTDTVVYADGEKGKRVDDIGAAANTSADPTLFGKALLYKESVRGDTAGTSDGNDVEQVFDAVATAQADLTAIKGVGFATGTDSLKVLSDNQDDIKGTGFATGTDSLKVLSDTLGIPAATVSDDIAAVKAVVDAIDTETDPAAIANAVWSELISGQQTADSMGRVLNDIFRLLKNKAIINATTKQLEVYDDAGVAIVFTFDLKDEFGVASATRIFRRIP